MSSSTLGQTGVETEHKDRVTWWVLVLEILYGGLFALVVTAINPWGDIGRGPIWTRPKVFVVLFLTLITWGYLFYSWLLPAESKPSTESKTSREGKADATIRMLQWQTSFVSVLTLIGWGYLLVSRFIPGSFRPEIIGNQKLLIAGVFTALAWGIIAFKWLTSAKDIPTWTMPQRETSFTAIFTTLGWGYLLIAPYLPGPLNLEPTRNQYVVAIMFTLLPWGVLLLRWLMAMRSRSVTDDNDASTVETAPSLTAVTSRPEWRWTLLLWGAYTALGLLSVYLSPSPTSALRAQVEMGDGWYYWAIVGAFTLGNVLLLSLNPRLFRAQLYGVLFGMLVLSLSLIPQVRDWTMDYTVNAGERIYNNKLRSTIYFQHMPIGLYSHRGHAAVVLAFGGVLALLSLMRGWLRPILAWPLFAALVGGVYLTSTRGAQLAFIVGLFYLFVRFPLPRLWRKLAPGYRVALVIMIPLVLAGGGFLALTGGGTRKMPSLSGNLDDISSGRTYLWRTGWAGIKERPLFGWGFNGFGLSWPFVADWNDPFKYGLINHLDDNIPVQEVLRVTNYDFNYIGTDGQRHIGKAYTNKAHNLFLDTMLSVGIVGFVAYLILIGFFIYLTGSGAGRGLEVIALVHLVYCLTWFDTAQFSHLVWWALSAGVALLIAERAQARAVSTNSIETSTT